MEPTHAEPTPEQALPGPSTDEAASIAPEAGAASEDRSSWLRNALRPFRRGSERADDAEPTDEQAAGEQSDAEPPWTAPSWESKDAYDRWLESQNRSYADRRDHAREQRDAQRSTEQLNAQIATLEEKKAAALRADDLWEVGELERQIVQLKRGGGGGDAIDDIVAELGATIAGETVARYDAILDQLMLRVPERERSALFPTDEEAHALSLWEQRAHVATKVADAIEKRAEDTARAKLRKDPVFRKQVLAEWRGTDEAEATEPVQVSAAAVGAGPTSMNDFLRSMRTHR